MLNERSKVQASMYSVTPLDKCLDIEPTAGDRIRDLLQKKSTRKEEQIAV